MYKPNTMSTNSKGLDQKETRKGPAIDARIRGTRTGQAHLRDMGGADDVDEAGLAFPGRHGLGRSLALEAHHPSGELLGQFPGPIEARVLFPRFRLGVRELRVVHPSLPVGLGVDVGIGEGRGRIHQQAERREAAGREAPKSRG